MHGQQVKKSSEPALQQSDGEMESAAGPTRSPQSNATRQQQVRERVSAPAQPAENEAPSSIGLTSMMAGMWGGMDAQGPQDDKEAGGMMPAFLAGPGSARQNQGPDQGTQAMAAAFTPTAATPLKRPPVDRIEFRLTHPSPNATPGSFERKLLVTRVGFTSYDRAHASVQAFQAAIRGFELQMTDPAARAAEQGILNEIWGCIYPMLNAAHQAFNKFALFQGGNPPQNTHRELQQAILAMHLLQRYMADRSNDYFAFLENSFFVPNNLPHQEGQTAAGQRKAMFSMLQFARAELGLGSRLKTNLSDGKGSAQSRSRRLSGTIQQDGQLILRTIRTKLSQLPGYIDDRMMPIREKLAAPGSNKIILALLLTRGKVLREKVKNVTINPSPLPAAVLGVIETYQDIMQEYEAIQRESLNESAATRRRAAVTTARAQFIGELAGFAAETIVDIVAGPLAGQITKLVILTGKTLMTEPDKLSEALGEELVSTALGFSLEKPFEAGFVGAFKKMGMSGAALKQSTALAREVSVSTVSDFGKNVYKRAREEGDLNEDVVQSAFNDSFTMRNLNNTVFRSLIKARMQISPSLLNLPR